MSKRRKITFETVSENILASVLLEAKDAHHTYEQACGCADMNWHAWYAHFIAEKLEKLGYNVRAREHSL